VFSKAMFPPRYSVSAALEIPLQETARNPAAPSAAPAMTALHCRIRRRLLYKHAGGTAYGKLVVQHERWEKLERVFAQALDWPASERPERLSRACGEDAELQREVAELLGAHTGQGVLDTPLLIANGAD